MPGTWCLEDGLFRETSGIPLSDRGFRYGMSVFESLAIRRGLPLLLETHLALLQQSCGVADFPYPEKLPAALESLSFDQDGMLRIYVTAGDGHPTEPIAASRTFAFFETTTFPSSEDVLRGFRLQTWSLTATDSDWGRKTGNYWSHVRALESGREKGCDETLVINGSQQIVSAAMANVFFVLDGALHTPAAGTGCREGAVKSWLRNQCAVTDSPLTLDDVRHAQECFLSNSRLGIMPVTEISERRLPSLSLARNLAVKYREEILGS